MTSGEKVTVIFPLYNTEETVPNLVDALMAQKRSGFQSQSEWLNAIFVDDASKDQTLNNVKTELSKRGNPKHIHVVENPENMGLSKSLNKAFGHAETEFVVTCQCDCLFATENFVSNMFDLISKRNDVAAITGQPKVDFSRPIPFAERVNLVANLMDLFPEVTSEQLIPVGFAEGRCDIFRISAFKEVDFYDTNLKIAGEDQVMSRRLRGAGYEICQAPNNPYFLSASNEQNSIMKLVTHQHLFGKTQPYILFASSGTQLSGIIGDKAGANRSLRSILRGSQILIGISYILAILIGFFTGAWAGLFGLLLLASIFKFAIFNKHLSLVPMDIVEKIKFFALLPILDIAYALGFIEGCYLLVKRLFQKKGMEEQI